MTKQKFNVEKYEKLKDYVDSQIDGISGIKLAIENALKVLDKIKKDKRVNYYNIRNLLKRALDLVPKADLGSLLELDKKGMHKLHASFPISKEENKKLSVKFIKNAKRTGLIKEK